MGKLSVILVMLNRNLLEYTLADLNFNNANLEAVLVDEGNRQEFIAGDITFTAYSFSDIDQFLKRADEFIWLISGAASDIGSVRRFATFLIASGVPKDNIVNFTVSQHINQRWLGNIKYIENHPVDYFATGISYTEVGLDIERISGERGIILAGSNQDLRQAYLTAQYVFDHQQSIKFVLIGLTPYSFRFDNLESFAVCSRNLQYLIGLKNSRDDSVHGQLLRMLLSGTVKKLFTSTTEEDADPNLMLTKKLLNKNLTAAPFIQWELELDNITKQFYPETFEKNLKYLEQYIQLCLEHGAKPVGIVFPFSPVIRKQYPYEQLSMFRRVLEQLKKAYGFETIDLFALPLNYSHFYNLAHLNIKGARLSSILINYELYKRGIKPLESMSTTNYNDLYDLSRMISDYEHKNFTDKLFELSAEKIRRKDKIKIGFVTYDASMWCGDLLYQLLERSDRYEPTVFMCLRRDKFKEPTVVKDFYTGVEQLRSHDLRVVAVDDDETEIPQQDLLIFLTPYQWTMPPVFLIQNLIAETLIVYIPYGAQVSNKHNLQFQHLTFMTWKIFWETKKSVELYRDQYKLLQGIYSGFPKLDVFFDRTDIHFDWKEAQPNSVKIIWAPHWSINGGVKFSTFQWNYEFFYEYAKAHPEISWVVKPHPNLMFSAVEEKLFPSAEAFEEYLNRWNELPNARVITGSYYFDIFQTSDAMILDSGSFIVEYQYTHKPLLYLTRDTQKFGPLVEELMQVLYRVDGHDTDGIKHFIEDVVINRNDPMASARRKFFDEHFNYVKDNGMLAGEFIFKTIDRELGGAVNG